MSRGTRSGVLPNNLAKLSAAIPRHSCSQHPQYSFVIPSERDRDWAERRPRKCRTVTQVGEVLRSEPDWHIAQDDNPLCVYRLGLCQPGDVNKQAAQCLGNIPRSSVPLS